MVIGVIIATPMLLGLGFFAYLLYLTDGSQFDSRGNLNTHTGRRKLTRLKCSE